jgi:hypothetical protein
MTLAQEKPASVHFGQIASEEVYRAEAGSENHDHAYRSEWLDIV